jgi:hypothetical protein
MHKLTYNIYIYENDQYRSTKSCNKQPSDRAEVPILTEGTVGGADTG